MNAVCERLGLANLGCLPSSAWKSFCANCSWVVAGNMHDSSSREMMPVFFFSIRSSRVCGTCLWIVGEFSLTTAQIEESLETLKQSLGPTPFFTQKKKHSQWEADPEEDDQATRDQYGKRHFGEASHDSMKEQKKKGPVVLADGSYATQTASSADVRALAEAQVPNLRALVLAGDFFLASVVSTTLTKLAMRYINIAADAGVAPADANRLHAECMLYIVCMIRLGESGETPTPMDSDSNDRMMVCIKTLAKPLSKRIKHDFSRFTVTKNMLIGKCSNQSFGPASKDCLYRRMKLN